MLSKFLHFEEIVRVKIAVRFEMIVSEIYSMVQLFKTVSFVADFRSKVELLLSYLCFSELESSRVTFNGYSVISGTVTLI